LGLEKIFMNESIAKLDSLLRDVVDHLKAGTKPDRRAAALKLDRLAAVATTLAFTIKSTR
jgi:hypothetical protein